MRVLTAVIALAASVAPAHAQSGFPDLGRPPALRVGGGENDAALVVAISDYTSLGDVRGAVATGQEWTRWLQGTLGVPFVKTLYNDDAWHLWAQGGEPAGILKELRAVAAKVKPKGRLWFVFIGHGASRRRPDGKAEGVLLGFNVPRSADAITATGLPVDSVLLPELAKLAGLCGECEAIAVLDACFSGLDADGEPHDPDLQMALLPDEVPKVPAGVTVLAGARSNEYAGPMPLLGRPAFSWLLLGGLRGWADDDDDRKVTLAEAHAFTAQELSRFVTGRTQKPWVAGGTTRPLALAQEKSPDFGALAAQQQGDLGKLERARAIRLAEEKLQNLKDAEAAEKEAERERARAQEAAAREAEWARTRDFAAGGGPEAVGALDAFLARHPTDNPFEAEAKELRARVAPAPAPQLATGGWRPIPAGTLDGARVAAFQMMRAEVTVAEYRACVKKKKCEAPDTGKYCNWDQPGRDDHPINCVSWHDAQDYARFDRRGAHLPSEREWEYAARSGGKSQLYPWGDEDATCERAIMDDGLTKGSAGDETAGCGENRTWSVCSMSPNGDTVQKLCDMAGNVWEWVAEEGVIRGGSWYVTAGALRAANRRQYSPSRRFFIVGFRLARPANP